MSTCSDPRYEEMLHDYEVGLLEGDDKQAFEMHLYDCEHCLAEVEQFSNESKLLRHDAQVRATVREIADGELSNDTISESQPARITNTSRTWLFRSLAAAALLIATAVPVYRSVNNHDANEPPGQILTLSPIRDAGSNVLALGISGPVEIRFSLGAAYLGSSIDVAITRATGDTVHIEEGLTNLGDRGQGALLVPLEKFSAGHYFLSVLDREGTGRTMLAQFAFRAE